MDFPGWRLIFRSAEDDVGSWILEHGGEAALLEVPPGLTVAHLGGVVPKYVLCSHEHEDHLDQDAWAELQEAFPCVWFLHPRIVPVGYCLNLGGEPLHLIGAAKHSMHDVVTVFRGVAMTGDIELGTIDSVNDEVPERLKRRSMRRLADFERRCDYHVHTVFSAHLNDLRTGVDFSSLFTL